MITLSSIDMIQIALQLWGAFFTLVSAAAAYLGRDYEKKKSEYLTIMLVINTVFLISDAVSWIATGEMTRLAIVALRVSDFAVFICVPMLAVMVALYYREHLLACQCPLPQKLLHGIYSLGVIDAVLIVISQFNHMFYYFDEQNVYHRSPGYVVCSMLAMAMMILLLLVVFLNRKKLSKIDVIVMSSYVILPFLTNLFQLFHYGLSLNNIAITVSLLLIFLTHEVKKSRHLMRQKQMLAEREVEMAQQKMLLSQKNKELAEKRIQISISQMQPHFVFNALGSIEQLCKQDSHMAADATHHFARYLRINMNALSSTDLVTIQDEMEHVRTYVWLEKMRFGDDIALEEHIDAVDFHLPSLTVQPLVENAIKHGMMGKEEGVLHVKLHVREKDDVYEVVVEDDGNGFNPTESRVDLYSHIGLSNVEERVKLMVNGKLIVESEIGKGTRVTIQIPK